MKIIVGVDDSDAAELAVRRALTFATSLEADLDVVFVSHVPATVMAAMAGVPTIGEDFADVQRAAVWKRIGPLIEGTNAQRVDLEGYPPDALVAHATSVGADLIIVGSRGRGDIASLLLGSTSHRVVNHSPCDVMIVRAEEG
jgi:nucleotide-binding universal stress UspA family protein